MGVKKLLGKALSVVGGVVAGKKGEKEAVDTENLSELSQLSPRAQVWRSITRPLVTFGIVGVLLLGVLIQYVQGIFGAEVIEIPKQMFVFCKWTLGFWFGSRGIEKILGKVL